MEAAQYSGKMVSEMPLVSVSGPGGKLIIKGRLDEKEQNSSIAGSSFPHVWRINAYADYGANSGVKLDETGKTYSDGVYADAGGTFTITEGTVNGSDGSMSAQGGILTANSSTITVGAWASEVNGHQGTINLNQSTTTGGYLVAQGYGAAVNVEGGTATVNHIIARQDTLIDQPIDAVPTEKTNLEKAGSAIGIRENATVTTDTLQAEDNGIISVSDATLTVKQSASFTNHSELAAVAGMVDLQNGLTMSDSEIHASDGGDLKVTGQTNMTNSNMYIVNNGHVSFQDWTAAGGSTTVGNADAGDASFMAEGDALTVDGTAKLNDHDLTIESGNTVSQGALEATHGTTVTVNGALKVTGNASLDGSTLTSTGTTTAGSLTAGNVSTVSVDGTLTVNGAASLTHSTLTSNGTTTMNSLSAEDRSNVTVNAGKTLDVAGNVVLSDSSDLITHGTTTIGKDLTAGKASQVTVDGTLNITGNAALTDVSNVIVNTGKELTVGGEMSLTDSKMESTGTTTLGSLTSKNSDILVDGGTFTVKGAVNTDHFKVTSGEVNFNNGGTMTGKVGVKDDGSDGVSALYIDGKATVNATNVTFTGGEVAVDAGGTLNLTGGTVDVPVDSFTTKGGTIKTDGTTIKSGVWAHDANGKNGTVTLNNSTLTGGSIGAQDSGEIIMNGGTADVDNVVLENGSTITFDKDASVTAGAITASGTGTNILNIRGGSQVTADSLTATGSTISITGSGNADDSHLTINGDTVLSEGSKVTMNNAANATFNGTVDIKDATSGITFTGENTSATFASGSKLYANSTAPAVTVSDKATLTFAKGSSVYTTASDQKDSNEKILVNTVAQATGDGQITVDEGASLYITNLDSSSTYSLAQVVTGNTDTATNPDGWAGNAYGSSMLQVVDKDSGKVENRDFDTAYNGTVLAGAVYDAVIKGGEDSAAYKFTDAVIQGQAGASDASEIARISNALNSHSGMTGLAGAGYGTYRFTTAFTGAAANHEEGDLWASYLHDKSSVDGLSVGSLRADYDLTYDGAVIGSDFYRNGDTTIGAAFAYADGDISTKSGVYTKNDVDYYGGMIYGSMKGAAGMTYRAEIGYNRSSNDITQVNTGSRITGSVDADAFHVGVSAEKAIQTGTGVWTPFVGLQYIDLSLDDYSDSLGFRHEGDSAGLWNMPIGVNYKYEMANGSWTYAPTVTLGYRFAFGDDSLNETFSYNGVGSTFGTEIAEDSFFTRIGFEAKKDNLGFGVHYGYERGSNTEANQWGIDCSFYF